MRIRRLSSLSFLKICILICGSLIALRAASKLDLAENYERLADSTLAKFQREKIKYPNETYYVIPNLISSVLQSKDSSDSNIVICTQASLNSLHQILNLAEYWDGQISMAVFSFDSEIRKALHYVLLLRKCSKDIRRKVSFHFVYPALNPPVNLTSIFDMDFDCHTLTLVKQKHTGENYAHGNISYPVNLLRNVALMYSTSAFVLNLDVDFVPSKQMKNQMETFLKERKPSDKRKKLAYVIPCFESNSSFPGPLSKKDLLVAVKNGSVRQFTHDKCFSCHVATKYSKWFLLPYPSAMNASYHVQFRIPYEPFYIADRKHLPMFDARFKQYGFNRVSQICEAFYSGYDFLVMNNAFVIHDGFKDPKKFYRWKAAENQRNTKIFYTEFKQDLRTKYPQSNRKC